MTSYNHSKIEDKWKEKWFADNIYEAPDFSEKPKKYILAEFPYPSGKALHAGHMMRYTVPDIYARFLRMNGYNVLFPMGWDAFGLPAENYAIKTGVHPAERTKEVVQHYKESFKKMGYGIDWTREINTTDPNYYKWTQWIFLKFLEAGLAEYKEMPIWWCEELKTVLSDEEVLTDKEGNKISERGEYPVERKMLKQWVLKITEYADKLIEGLDLVDFPEAIKQAQINWIGRSEGASVDFKINENTVNVFTTRPDTLYGVTFMAIAPEHPMLDELINQAENKKEILAYVKDVKSRSDLERQIKKEKTGVQLKGIFAKHPFEDVTRKIPVFVADYVLMDYGSGIVMGVPAHDERDYDFANKYNLEIISVIKAPAEFEGTVYTGMGEMINSGDYNGMKSIEFFEAAIDRLVKEGKGKKDVNFKIRDWIFSRQRYWGEPIPVIHTEDGKVKPVCNPEDFECVNEKLPLELPEVPDYNPTSDGTSPLERNAEWVNITDENGNPAKRETNTMPNWAGSCWYYIRYTDPHNNESFADIEKMKYWLPVDKYFGGAEHTTMHLLYSRFWHKFLYDQGEVPTPEPYQWRMNGGLLLGPDGTKMSKSKGNVIEPMDIVENYGADALRTFIAFLGPYTDTYPWNSNGIKATWRLMKNIYELKEQTAEKSDETVLKAYHTLVKNVSNMIPDLKMNTAVSEIMIFINTIKNHSVGIDEWKGFIKILAPFAPFLAEELWQDANGYTKWKKENSVHLQTWPTYDEKIIREDTITIPVQVNGKVRGEITIHIDDTEKAVIAKAVASERIQDFLQGHSPKKTVYVKGRIVNLVV